MSQQDDNQEQSFNDAELQDIMNEIESLEREFVEEESETVAAAPVTEDVVEAPTSEAPQENVEATETQAVETEESIEHSDEEDAASLVSEVSDDEYEDNVVSIGERRETTSTPTTSTPGHMQFSGAGKMDFNLNFLVGDSNAEVNVKEGKLLVTMAGVELTLSENGCEVSMEGGVKFSVPISATTASKKAA